MMGLVRPTLLLTPSPTPGFSKLGGRPQLSRDLAWPSGRMQPCVFLAQIDLSEIPPDAAIEWLPKQGRLFAFHDTYALDDPEGVRILFSTESPGGPIPQLAETAGSYAERHVSFVSLKSAPSLDWLGLDDSELDLDPKDFRALGELVDAPTSDAIQFRIGGYPNEIQPERMWLSCEHVARGLPEPVWGHEVAADVAQAAESWRLLLQIDSDPALKMNFGDGGRLYVFIRERHARAGDFSKTVTLWQTY
jgi:hypothetical protein